MRQEKRRQLREIDSLLCGIEQNVRWSRERLAWRVANYAKRKEWKSALGARACDKFRLHVCSVRACGLCDSLSLHVGIDYRRHRQKIGGMNRQLGKGGACFALFDGRKIFREEEVADT